MRDAITIDLWNAIKPLARRVSYAARIMKKRRNATYIISSLRWKNASKWGKVIEQDKAKLLMRCVCNNPYSLYTNTK